MFHYVYQLEIKYVCLKFEDNLIVFCVKELVKIIINHYKQPES